MEWSSLWRESNNQQAKYIFFRCRRSMFKSKQRKKMCVGSGEAFCIDLNLSLFYFPTKPVFQSPQFPNTLQFQDFFFSTKKEESYSKQETAFLSTVLKSSNSPTNTNFPRLLLFLMCGLENRKRQGKFSLSLFSLLESYKGMLCCCGGVE